MLSTTTDPFLHSFSFNIDDSCRLLLEQGNVLEWFDKIMQIRWVYSSDRKLLSVIKHDKNIAFII